MGFLKRAADRSTDRFWNSLPPLDPREGRVDYAHVVVALDDGDRPGTAYLTTDRLIFQQADGRSLPLDLADCYGFTVLDDRPGQMGLRAVFPVSDKDAPFVLVLWPQQTTKANRTLAASFVQAVARELLRHHPEWAKR